MNERIRAPEIRLVGSDGAQVGIVSTQEALRMAEEQDLDLVEVAPQAKPPVCRIMDYGKYKYEQALKQKEARKKQTRVDVKEIKFRPKIDIHDYETKKGHVVRFLNAGARVKVTIMFRGREMAHTELGRKILDRLVADLDETAIVDQMPKLDGRNMIMVISPAKRLPTKAEAPPKAPAPEGAPAASEEPAPESTPAPENAPAPEEKEVAS
ncbi:MAG TPA: translation initiation factor IF-3 [Actinomycetota bacterium]